MTSMAMIYSQGISLRFDDDPDPIHNTLYQWVQDIVEHKVEYTELAERLRSRARKRPRSSPGEGGSGDGRSIV